MLPVGWLIAAVVVAVLLSMWVTFTLTRLDRLHARVDAAWAALDAQLVRRAAALQHVGESAALPAAVREDCERVALEALAASGMGQRQVAENAVGRMVAELSGSGHALAPGARAELHEGAVRVQVARRFYNDAARDTRALRSRRMPRIFRLAGRRAMPQFFDIDDTVRDAVTSDVVNAPDGSSVPVTEPAAERGTSESKGRR